MRSEAAEVTFKALKVWQKPISQVRSCRSGSLLSDGEKIYLHLLLQTLKHTLNTLLGAFRQATPLISKKVRLFPPHMVFRAPRRNPETERHLFTGRTLALQKTACLHLWRSRSKQAWQSCKTKSVFQRNSHHSARRLPLRSTHSSKATKTLSCTDLSFN